MSTKQLYEKTSEGMKEVSPLVSIEDIYSKLSDTPLEALVSLFNHVKCKWKGSVADTRRTVPLFLRRSGLFITYNNGTKYITEFFSAGTDQITTEGWVKDSNWTPVPDEDYISAGVKPGVGSIGYEQLNDNLKQLFREKVNVTNFPDNEDIVSVDNMLKFKDRNVDATNFQSKGYVILRKNLHLINGAVKNILTNDMINQPNTIYEIRYDFDLNGNNISLQENSILKFTGGKISNGRVLFYKNALTINSNFENVEFVQATNNVLPYSIIKLYTSIENLKNTTSVRYKDIVYLKTEYGIKPYEISTAGSYYNKGAISLDKLKNIEAVPLSTNVRRGVINITNYGIYPNGEDMSDKLNSFLSSSMKWLYEFSTLYFPGGVYKFTKPIKFITRCNIVGDNVSIIGNEYTGTVFDFSDVKNPNENESLYCITAEQQLYNVSNITFISNSYKLIENRNNILNTQTEAWTETINQKNICCIKRASYINECYFRGWSGSCILGNNETYVTNCYFTNNNLCLNFMNDCTATNIWAKYCSTIIKTGVLNTISNIRGDSIKEEAIISNQGGFIDNILIDWGYKSVFGIRGNNTATFSFYVGSNYNISMYRNVVNTKLINKKTLDGINVTYDMGVVSIKRIDGIKNFNSNLSIQGNFLSNIKDGSINYESDKVTTISIPLTIDVKTIINFNGVINITLFDINIEDIIADVSLIKNFIYMISGKATGEVILNNKPFYLKELDKEHYDNEHIIYLGDNKIPCNGTTLKRPVNIKAGFFFYDTTLNKPIWWTGENWIDATGADV